MRLIGVLLALFGSLGLGTPLLAERIHSYVDEDGVKVFTNLGVNRESSTAAPPPPAPSTPIASGNYSSLIQQSASRHGIDQDLINAIIKVESDFNPKAVSVKNCKGLMQLHPDTARRFGVKDIFDPAQNIEGGVKYLSYLIDFFDRKLDYVLAAYNAGENAVVKYQGIPPYRETRDYIKKVKGLFDGDLEPADTSPPKRNLKIVRMEDPSGNVLLTNAPTR